MYGKDGKPMEDVDIPFNYLSWLVLECAVIFALEQPLSMVIYFIKSRVY